ncbi:hypothetical protein [Rhodococcus sp. IEGM 1379]|uniref:hypothetical protein n=1 Tax=Rhodococcus sp. IEGM 1379 TaxID=3047086 RepID=UPI0024B79F92|nr:hypothetical protein [Rhodococcus sp. IEGM 1379]MDI9917649.1 hypothetical protein [Rhodococcus sp. IEGM 1379]
MKLGRSGFAATQGGVAHCEGSATEAVVDPLRAGTRSVDDSIELGDVVSMS